jgi:hypothetical protein
MFFYRICLSVASNDTAHVIGGGQQRDKLGNAGAAVVDTTTTIPIGFDMNINTAVGVSACFCFFTLYIICKDVTTTIGHLCAFFE